jgi:hypothetical protein
MKTLTPFFLVWLIAILLAPANASADGMFVVPRFVWDKYKDINEPTQKAILVYDAGREDLILQVKYEGSVDQFGWLIPVPNLPTVQKGSMKCFYELSQYTQKLWEPPAYKTQGRGLDLGSAGVGGKPEPPVKVIEIKTVGAYEIAVLSTGDSGALAKWLDANRFYFPTNKTDVLDFYVQRQWYFVAVRINLTKSGVFQLLTAPRQVQNELPANYSAHLKLAGGELNPLQISFTSDRCVFPLKISSVNDKPSEVQVYVLSPEPLLEKGMLGKKLPLIYSNDLARAATRAQQFERIQMMQRDLQMHFMGGTLATPPSLSPEDKSMIQKMSETPNALPNDLLHFVKVTKADLPDSSKWISRLEDKSWWLTKQAWTFKPEEMRDLEFQPAMDVFAGELGTKYGYFAAASLAWFGTNAVPALIDALRSTNSIVRVDAASILDDSLRSISDPRLTQLALSLLKDPEPKVRIAAIEVLTEYLNWNPENAESLVAMLRDEDVGVRHAAAFYLPQFRNDLNTFIPAFQELLKDNDPGVRATGLSILQRLQVEIPREELLPFFKLSDPEAVGNAFGQMRIQDEKISDDDALPLLQNSQPVARLFGLKALDQNPEKQSFELALPLLNDPEQLVRVKAAQTLRALTGQHFTEDQADQWQNWWTANKTNFVVLLHPEELQPRRVGTNDFRRYLTNRPFGNTP